PHGSLTPAEAPLIDADILFRQPGPAHLLFQLGQRYADSALDDIVFIIIVAFFLCVALTIFSVRRYRDLAHETKARAIAEGEARDLTRQDPLTGLPNRRLFNEKLDACLGLARDTHQVAVLLLGLDGFKMIKDKHGHAAEDKALCEFANRVAEILQKDGVLARIGGDEFGIVLPGISSLETPTNLARRIVASASETFATETGAAELGVAIGIAIAPTDGINLHGLVRRAERALYRAQGDGRSHVRFFEPEMDMHVDRRIQIERELRSAIKADIIEPHYQPIVSLKENCIIGFEALARWENRTWGRIPPDVFSRP
ncbi:GGDEF domain-containing protein, partial [Bradyrhizobium sp. LVM 105]|uniref:GGDEF domain-containing protein n=1 Tax=Bradyrhizobium sp. LVM 105 TaxID=2341115 RepID=UPI000F80A7C2